MTDIEREEWLPVVGWEGYYEVSDLGRVRSLERVVRRRDGSRYTVRERVLKPGVRARDGYMHFSLSRRGLRRCVSVATLRREFVAPQPGRSCA